MSNQPRNDRCICPFRKSGEKGHVGKDLRPLSLRMLQMIPSLPKNCRVCANCRKMFMSSSQNTAKCTPDTTDNFNILDDSSEFHIEDSVKDENDSRAAREIELEELLIGLKEKFSSLQGSDPLKLKILTIAPESWSVNKICKEFGTSWQLAKKAKELRTSRGILPDVTAKSGNVLPASTVVEIVEFYESDSNSRMLPGIKDCVSVSVDGQRTKVQKKLLLLNLNELFSSFNELHPEISVGFSIFAKLRPKHCVLPGSSGTHSVCVCTIHQNCKLMLDAIDIKKLTCNSNKPIYDYKDCLKLLMCENPEHKCHLNECNKCPSIDTFSSMLLTMLDNASIIDIEYSSWTSTDRCTLQTIKVQTNDFVDELCSKLIKLKPHSFIAKQQSLFISEKKKYLAEEEVIVMFDFSENYAYAVQDAVQAFHFNNDQCTVFPVIYYYREESQLKHKSCIFLSNSLKHDTAAVYTVQNMLIPEIKKTC